MNITFKLTLSRVPKDFTPDEVQEEIKTLLDIYFQGCVIPDQRLNIDPKITIKRVPYNA